MYLSKAPDVNCLPCKEPNQSHFCTKNVMQSFHVCGGRSRPSYHASAWMRVRLPPAPLPRGLQHRWTRGVATCSPCPSSASQGRPSCSEPRAAQPRSFIAPRGWAKLLPCIRKHHLEKDIQEHGRHVSSAAPTKICLSVNVTPQTYLKCPFLSPIFLCSFSLFFYTKCQLFSIWVIP